MYYNDRLTLMIAYALPDPVYDKVYKIQLVVKTDEQNDIIEKNGNQVAGALDIYSSVTNCGPIHQLCRKITHLN